EVVSTTNTPGSIGPGSRSLPGFAGVTFFQGFDIAHLYTAEFTTTGKHTLLLRQSRVEISGTGPGARGGGGISTPVWPSALTTSPRYWAASRGCRGRSPRGTPSRRGRLRGPSSGRARPGPPSNGRAPLSGRRAPPERGCAKRPSTPPTRINGGGRRRR